LLKSQLGQAARFLFTPDFAHKRSAGDGRVQRTFDARRRRIGRTKVRSLGSAEMREKVNRASMAMDAKVKSEDQSPFLCELDHHIQEGYLDPGHTEWEKTESD
jgi:hypothetical protein